MIRGLPLFGLVLATGALGEPARQDRELMHTKVTVVIADPVSAEALQAAFDDAFAVFSDLDQTVNEWKPESVLGKINAGAGGAAVPAPAPVCEVIKTSLDGAKRTNGLFDPTCVGQSF